MMEAFQSFLRSPKIYKPDDIGKIIKMVFTGARVTQTPNRKLRYYDISCSLDIETTSFYSENNKRANMYLWSMCLGGCCVIGRTWEQAINCFEALSDELKLAPGKRLIIYVHNLSFEFQFLRKWLEWSKVFAVSRRKPVYAVSELGIEFRCSYLLSGYSLASLGKQLRTYPVEKLTGDLDYSLARHSTSFLTGKEIAYSVNDAKVVAAYIQEQIDAEGSLTVIPITKTGYVRRFCRNECFYSQGIPRKKSWKRLRYMDMISNLTLEPEEYQMLKRAFQGGFVHCNAFYSGETVTDVCSYDFTSSYPAVMVAEQFPMSKGERYQPKNKADFNRCIKLYCCVFNVRLTGLKPKRYYENYISVSRCWGVQNARVNNGRIVSATALCTTITEQDWLIINEFYEYESVSVSDFIRYKKGYLPKDFVGAILKLYIDKTQLKGVEGRETDYQLAKGMLNSCYGMTVTDIVREENEYKGDGWLDPKQPDLAKALKLYNKSSSRFLFYPWGVWVTAYARRNLFTGIMEWGPDYVYSDTDSIKGLNADDHAEYIDEYNRRITRQLDDAMKFHGYPVESIRPKTIQGVEKPLGVWDREEGYDRFKSLGAKRYMSETNGKLSITVSGLNKKVTVPFLASDGNDAAFDLFSADLYVPPEYTGKNTHTYIDDEISGVLTDYLGFDGSYHEKSFVHLEAADYSLGLAQEYADYILGIKEIEI